MFKLFSLHISDFSFRRWIRQHVSVLRFILSPNVTFINVRAFPFKERESIKVCTKMLF